MGTKFLKSSSPLEIGLWRNGYGVKLFIAETGLRTLVTRLSFES